jgi:hypothetical protein
MRAPDGALVFHSLMLFILNKAEAMVRIKMGELHDTNSEVMILAFVEGFQGRLQSGITRMTPLDAAS